MQQIYPKISASFLSTSKKDLKNSLLFVYYTEKNKFFKKQSLAEDFGLWRGFLMKTKALYRF